MRTFLWVLRIILFIALIITFIARMQRKKAERRMREEEEFIGKDATEI